MIKKYFLDILCLFLIAIGGFFVVQRPTADLILPPSFSEKRGPLDRQKEDLPKEKRLELIRETIIYNSLKGRNIFSVDGIYPLKMEGAAPRGTLPEKPYTLIGILQGEEKKAVFREHTGAIVTLTIGKKLIDGSVITRINTLSVELERGKEKRELRIFEYKTPKPLTLKKP